MNEFKKAFTYPFSFIKGTENYYYSYDRYLIENFTLTMFNKNLKSEKIDLNALNYPQDIVEVYGYQEGINDEKEWQGDMKIYISKSLKRKLNYAVEKNINQDLYHIVNNKETEESKDNNFL